MLNLRRSFFVISLLIVLLVFASVSVMTATGDPALSESSKPSIEATETASTTVDGQAKPSDKSQVETQGVINYTGGGSIYKSGDNAIWEGFSWASSPIPKISVTSCLQKYTPTGWQNIAVNWTDRYGSNYAWTIGVMKVSAGRYRTRSWHYFLFPGGHSPPSAGFWTITGGLTIP